MILQWPWAYVEAPEHTIRMVNLTEVMEFEITATPYDPKIDIVAVMKSTGFRIHLRHECATVHAVVEWFKEIGVFQKDDAMDRERASGLVSESSA